MNTLQNIGQWKVDILICPCSCHQYHRRTSNWPFVKPSGYLMYRQLYHSKTYVLQPCFVCFSNQIKIPNSWSPRGLYRAVRSSFTFNLKIQANFAFEIIRQLSNKVKGIPYQNTAFLLYWVLDTYSSLWEEFEISTTSADLSTTVCLQWSPPQHISGNPYLILISNGTREKLNLYSSVNLIFP